MLEIWKLQGNKINVKKVWLIIGIAILAICLFYVPNIQKTFVNKEQKYGIEPIDCAFKNRKNLSTLECYNIHVPEIYGNKKTQTITFPLRIFKSLDGLSSKNPVLHLGAGGPGEAMGLDDSTVLRQIAKDHGAISFEQGRDLFVIDPRGTGLSKPLLNCLAYSNNLLDSFKHKQNLNQQFSFMEDNYLTCINQFRKSQINFNGYNSSAISNDIEMLRGFFNIDKWVLFGVSYSTVYAMNIDKQYPNSVEKMVLDSAYFPNLKDLRHFLLNAYPVFLRLYNYADVVNKMGVDVNITMDMDIKTRIWNLHEKLNNYPLDVGFLDLKVDGNNFINTLVVGAYGTDIFTKLPQVIREMENNNSKTFSDFFESYLLFLEDKDYAVISSLTHYCYEHEPFIDFEKLNKQIFKLDKGYMQENARKTVQMNYFCKEMNITSTDKSLADAIKTDTPTLFIHGMFDTVTPLIDVLEQMKGFSNSKLLTYNTSHSVMEDGEVEKVVAQFIKE